MNLTAPIDTGEERNGRAGGLHQKPGQLVPCGWVLDASAAGVRGGEHCY